MDSINLAETQSTPLNCRNTASNTSPIACACCGSKDYTQTIPHANYFRALCPGISRCKHTQDDCEDNGIVPQFFSSVPMLQPFLHNFPMPASTFCPHNHSDDSVAGSNQSSEQNPAESEKTMHRSGDYYVSDLKEKAKFKDDKTSFYENPQKSFVTLGPESQFPAYPFFIPNPKDIKFSPCFQRCACGDPTPWTCSPFIVPIVSYCLLWNSHKYNNSLPPNDSGNQSEMMFQQHNDAPSNTSPLNSNTNDDNTQKNFNIVDNQHMNNLSDNKNHASEDLLEDDNLAKAQWNTDDKSNANSAPLTVYSVTFTKDNPSNNPNNLKKNDENSDSNDMEEAMELDGFVDADQMGSEESLKIDENTPSTSEVQPVISVDSNDLLKDNEDIKKRSSLPKVHEKSEGSAEHLRLSESGESNFLSLKRSYRKIQDSDEEYGNKSSESKATIFEERISFKKFIKNFTITDQTTNGLPTEAHIYAAAAGDLGGENCVGYKVQILPSEGDQQEKIRKETQTEVNLEAKGALLLKGLTELKEKQSENFLDKNAETKISRVKSGIAKPSRNTKPREAIESNTKNNNSESSQENSYVVKRRHSCFPCDNSTGSLENSSKMQKMKNYSAAHRQNLGLGRLQRTMNTKVQAFKKEEEIATSKVRPHGLQKQTNAAVKNIKK